MTDDEILDALDRRLADVDGRLPPRRVAVAGSLVGRPARPGKAFRGSMPVVTVALLVVAVAVALGLGGRSSGGVAGEASPANATPSTVAKVVTPSPTAGTLVASSSRPGLEVIRDVNFDGDHVLTQRMGWGPCLMSGDALMVFPNGRDLDAAIDRAGVIEGLVALDRSGSFWVGPTAESAARGYESPILVIDRRLIAWIVQPGDPGQPDSVGRELRTVPTPKGRIAWFLGNSVRDAPCTDG